MYVCIYLHNIIYIEVIIIHTHTLCDICYILHTDHYRTHTNIIWREHYIHKSVHLRERERESWVEGWEQEMMGDECDGSREGGQVWIRATAAI